MHRIATIAVLLASTMVAATAADQDLPLGTVTAVADDAVTVAFDAAVALAPDDVLALYGPGLVERHPLNDQVVREQRKLVAKLHVHAVTGGTVRGRVYWLAEGVVLEPGFDAVPLPGEASPNAPPVLGVAVLEPLAVPAQATVAISLPISDPEGDAVAYRWSLVGPRGASGLLAARDTAQPTVEYTAPASPGVVELRVAARDEHGQLLEAVQPITIGEVSSDWRKRALRVASRVDVEDPVLWMRLEPEPAGGWWGIDLRGHLLRIDSGWNRVERFAVQEDSDFRYAAAVVPLADRVVVLDRDQRALLVIGHDGVQRQRIGGLGRPTDLVLDRSGAAYVADQDAGGVLVFEPDGRFRCRLGRPGDEALGFEGLTRLALGADGTLHALDSERFLIHRFDRHHRRLPSWEIQGDRDIPPVDLAVHPRGLLVLMEDGSIQLFDAQGHAGQGLRALAASGLFERLKDPAAIGVDRHGGILVTYPEDRLLARYAADGRLAGVRGGRLWERERIAVDGRGHAVALDERSGWLWHFDENGWLLGRFGGSDRVDGPFAEPGALAAAPDGGSVAVIDRERVAVLRFDLAAPQDAPFVFGQEGANPGQFEEPIAIALDDAGRSYVLDADLHRVAIFDRDGRFVMNVGRYERGRERDELDEPALLAVSPAGDALYVYDQGRYEVMKFVLDHAERTWRHVSNAGGRGDELGQYQRPVGMACDRLGLLYVADDRREDLQVIDFRGTNAVTVHVADFEALGIDDPQGLALMPDGMPWLYGEGRVAALRWR